MIRWQAGDEEEEGAGDIKSEAIGEGVARRLASFDHRPQADEA